MKIIDGDYGEYLAVRLEMTGHCTVRNAHVSSEYKLINHVNDANSILMKVFPVVIFFCERSVVLRFQNHI